MKVCSLCGKQWPDTTRFCPSDGSNVVTIAARDDSIRPSFQNREKKVEPADPWTNIIGKILNRTYQVEEKLGQGGMGAVFRARHLGIGDSVALKIISEEHTQDSVMLARFRREAQAVRRLAHPNAVAVFDFNSTEDGLFFMVMEYVKGQTVEQYLSEQGVISPERAFAILKPVAKALDVAHSLGIIHRDIKPANLMLCQDSAGKEQVKVLDFGTARLNVNNDPEAASLTQQGQIFGTPFYMAPESVLGEPITHSVDIYSLGVILYKMLTGTVPFQSERSMQVMMAHAHMAPELPSLRNPKLPAKYDPVILKALEKNPGKRYQNTKELIDNLEGSINEPVLLSTPTSVVVEDKSSGASSTISRVKLASLQEPDFNCYVGREQELKRLQEAFSQACDARANPVFIISTPGMGKTQLISRFRDWANEQGGLVLMAKFFDYRGTISEPLRVFKNMLVGLISTGMLNSMPVVLLTNDENKKAERANGSETGNIEKWQVFTTLANSFMALTRNRTVVLILDDLQWADSLSLEFIAYLLRNAESKKFCFIGGSHAEEAKSKGHPFREWLVKQAQYTHYEKMELQPFDKKGIQTLLEAIFHFIEVSQKDIELLHKLTGGNPLYLTEVIRLLMENQHITFKNGVWYGSGFDEVKLPDTVANVIRYKIEACSEELREILNAAAVIGDTFSFDLLQKVLEIDETVLEKNLAQAVKESLLKEDGKNEDDYQFYNITIRRVIYDDVPKRQRKKLHSRTAIAIAKVNAGKSYLTSGALAYHFYSAGEWEAAAKYSTAAIEQAFDRQAMDEVIRLSRYAEESLTRLSEEFESDTTEYRRSIGQIRVKRAIALMRLGSFKEAQAEAEATQQFIEKIASPELQARLYLVLTELCFWFNRHTEGVNIGSRGLVLARQANNDECVRYMMFYLAWCKVQVTPVQESISVFQQIIDLAKQASDSSLQARALSVLGNLTHVIGQWRRSRIYLEEAYQLTQSTSDRFAESQVLLFLTWTLEFENNFDKLKTMADQAIKIAHDYGWRNWEGYQYYVLGRSFLRRLNHNYPLAEEMLSRSLSIMEETHDSLGQLIVSKELVKLQLETNPEPTLVNKIRDITFGFSKNREMVSTCEALLILAEAEDKFGNFESAVNNYNQALKIAEMIPFLEIQWRIHYGLAQCFKKQEDESRAIEHMIRSIEVINRLKQEFDSAEAIASFLENKEEVYSAYAELFSS
jgi:serine/threonine-protein kinase